MKVLRKIKDLSPGDLVSLGEGLFTVMGVSPIVNGSVTLSVKRKPRATVDYVVMIEDLIETIPHKKL